MQFKINAAAVFGLMVFCLVGCQLDGKPAALAKPALRVPVTQFGAVADGTTLNTKSIQATIDDVASKGGGTVVIPPGVFLSGSVFLKSGVGLHIEKDGVLKGTTNVEDYPKQNTRIEGHFEPWLPALVNVDSIDGLRISGDGTLDGSGQPFWQAFGAAIRANRSTKNLDVPRPRLMLIQNSKDVQISGLRFKDSGFWNLHIYKCDGVLVDGLDIRAGMGSPSTDGIDIDSSQNVTVRKCYISTHDDNIALKGSKGPFADQDADSPPVENILVEDTEVGDGNGLITCGSEATLVRNVTVRNCVMTGHATMLTLKLRPDTPQHYENITMENIRLAGSGRLLNVAPWMQFFDLKGQPPPARRVNNVTLRNITGRYRTLGVLGGNAGDVLRDITLENVDVQLADGNFRLGPVENLQLKNVTVNGKPFVPPAVTPPPPLRTQ